LLRGNSPDAGDLSVERRKRRVLFLSFDSLNDLRHCERAE
jgi:hypothetical protein